MLLAWHDNAANLVTSNDFIQRCDRQTL